MTARGLADWYRRYTAASDVRIANANLIAMVLGWNTPSYPVWLAMIGGTALFPGALLTTLATPFFLLVPAATRRWPPGGRIYFATVCLVNTTFCSWLPGGASGTSLFLLPGVTLAGLIFHRAERPALLTFLSLPLLAGVLLDASQPYSPFGCGGDACVGLWRMNMASVAVLFVFFGFLASRDDP